VKNTSTGSAAPSVAEPETWERPLFAGAGAGAQAQVFRLAPGMEIHIKCYKKPYIFHTKI
jgi:hypothetical protein